MVGSRTSARSTLPASKAARQAFSEGLTARAADFEAPVLEGEATKGKGRSTKGKGDGKGKKELTAEEKEKREFNKDMAA